MEASEKKNLKINPKRLVIVFKVFEDNMRLAAAAGCGCNRGLSTNRDEKFPKADAYKVNTRVIGGYGGDKNW